MKDYYDILGVSEDASNEQIKKAFKDIAKKEHPDRGGNETRFKEANEAYDTLKNSQKRHDYDTMRKFGGTGGQQHPFFNEDIFGDFFSGFGNGDMDFGDDVYYTIDTGFAVNDAIGIGLHLGFYDYDAADEETDYGISIDFDSGFSFAIIDSSRDDSDPFFVITYAIGG